jgi:putative transposase
MREKRNLENGAKYHVIAKINRGELIFQKDEIKKMFLLVMKRAKMKYKFGIMNFCIMNNHIHLIIEPKGNENLSRIMQWILSVFAVKYNQEHKIYGHIWYDRFKSSVIKDIKQYLKVYFYICENPIKAGIINKFEDYQFGGLYYILRGDFDLIEKGTEVTGYLKKK